MQGFARRACLLVVAVVITTGGEPLRGAPDDPIYTDPVGYLIHPVPGDSEVLMPLQLAKPALFMEYVTEVTSSGVRFSRTIPTGAFNTAIGGIFEVRIGSMAGIGIPATGISGNFVTLERSPLGLVSPGDFASLREQQTLGELFGDPEYFPFLTGTSPDVADNISTWDAKTQTSRVFYRHTGVGWREAGKFSEGDKSNAMIPFPSGIIVRRRAPTQADVFVQGSVIMPTDQRYHPVWAGRNIISAPFTSEPTIASYIRPLLDAPHTVVAAASAPRADTLRFYGFDGAISPVIYYQNNRWRAVGNDQDASGTAVQWIPCLDLQRVGPAGYIRFEGTSEGEPASSPRALRAAETVVEVRPVTLSGSAAEITATWPSKPGLAYQVQTRALGSGTWSNLNTPVQANGASASTRFKPAQSGCIRVIGL